MRRPATVTEVRPHGGRQPEGPMIDVDVRPKAITDTELRRDMLPARRYLTTAEAAAFCGMTQSALRKAAYRGQVRPAGKRGGAGKNTWAIEELERFMTGGRTDGQDEKTRTEADVELRRVVSSGETGRLRAPRRGVRGARPRDLESRPVRGDEPRLRERNAAPRGAGVASSAEGQDPRGIADRWSEEAILQRVLAKAARAKERDGRAGKKRIK